jgi:hypothetical protein
VKISQVASLQFKNQEEITANCELVLSAAEVLEIANCCDSWWRQVKSYTVMFMERVKDGVEAVKEFLFTLASDERWGVMLEMEQNQPQMFDHLVASAPDWVEWMG